MLCKKGIDGETPLESKMFSSFVESAQKKIEGNNFDSRKTVLEYDEVLRKQREIIYNQRSEILFLEDITDIIVRMMESTMHRLAYSFLESDRKNSAVDIDRFMKESDGIYFPLGFLRKEDLANLSAEALVDVLIDKCNILLQEKRKRKIFLQKYIMNF